jgi:hypothetical protein
LPYRDIAANCPPRLLLSPTAGKNSTTTSTSTHQPMVLSTLLALSPSLHCDTNIPCWPQPSTTSVPQSAYTPTANLQHQRTTPLSPLLHAVLHHMAK